MDRCPRCSKRTKVVLSPNGRTEFKCLQCDQVDPLCTDAAKWAESALANVSER
jgi:tRNA(Ile2) C34 agmatinyltransferase TiaS